MNIIDAWKAAKEGQKIQHHNRCLIKSNDEGDFKFHIPNCSESDLLADDWEVVKEKKTKICTLYDVVHRAIYTIPSIPVSAKVTIEWEE